MPGIQLIINLSTISSHKKKVLSNASNQDYQTIFNFGMVYKLKVEWTGLNMWSSIGDSFPRILFGGPLQPASLVVVAILLSFYHVTGPVSPQALADILVDYEFTKSFIYYFSFCADTLNIFQVLMKKGNIGNSTHYISVMRQLRYTLGLKNSLVMLI